MLNILLCTIALIAIPEQHPDFDSSKVYEMPEVVVTATRWKWILDTCPLLGEIVEIKDIERISDLGAIIKSMVNSDIVSYGGEGSSKILSLRGASPEQTLFLLDGARINTAQGSSIDLALWPLSWIERIEIYRVGRAVDMGAQAIGGIVNIVTREEEKNQQLVSLRFGSQNFFDINAFASLNFFNNFNLWAGLQRKQGIDDFWYVDENRDTIFQRENADFKNMSAITKLKYTFGINDLEINFNGHVSDRGSPGMSEFPTPDARLNDEIYVAQAKFKINKIPFFSSETKTYVNWFTRNYFNSQPIVYADDMHKNLAFGIDERLRIIWSSHFKIVSGLELRKDNLSSTTDGERKRKSIAAFLQTEVVLGNKDTRLLLLPGVRIEWIDEFEPEICPGLGAVYTLSKNIIFKATTERTFRPPNFDDLFWPASAMAVGNPNLLPEDAINFDIGTIFYSSSKRLRISCAGFYRNVKNLIEWAPGAKGMWRPHNVGKAVIKGIEGELSYFLPLTEKVFFEFVSNYTYTEATDLTGEPNTTGKQLIRKPMHKANLQMYLSISEKYQVSTTWNYVSLRYTTSANTKWIPQYVVGNCNILYQLNNNISISLAVKNVMDRRYIDVTGFPIPGRTWHVKTSLEF